MNDRQRDAYYRREYGITLEEYLEMGDECMICGAKPKTRALHVDHDHHVAKQKIEVFKHEGMWTARCGPHDCVAISRKLAKGHVQEELRRASVRGKLCWACNALLKKGRDNPDILNNAALYLLAFSNKRKAVS